ncbi:hypothetical protein ABFT23_02050 [Nocardioides sp. C4-1]|uniref:hypothetical protein n=1 Tax=Nocardioides sp. C4-1 TaxID=3151851 RepID=UPI003264A1E4
MSGRRNKHKPNLPPLPKQNTPAATTTAAGDGPTGVVAGSSAGDGGRLAKHTIKEFEAWRKSRHGATAGRGFHFQDAVGAWLAVGILTGTVDVDRLVPEGFEDLCGEGGSPVDWQVKSRQDRVGEFLPRDVGKYALKLAREHRARSSSSRAVLALERGIKDADVPGGSAKLNDLALDHPLRLALADLVDDAGTSQSDVDDAVELVEVLIVSNAAVRRDAVAALAAHLDVLPAVAEKVLLAIRDRVSQCVDTNAAVELSERVGVDRTALESIAERTLVDVDPSALGEALSTGACHSLDLDSALVDDQYYLGLDAQPGHIAAGLPAQRPDLDETISAALNLNRCVLLTGPSGVGKSTAMWAAAAHVSNVTWFRVLRLDVADVEPIARLAAALRPSARTPVGFLVDAVGLSDAPAWDRLVDRLAAMPHVRLLGTARTEDLVALRSLSATKTVDVRLDETVAATIFEGLRASGATSAAHWREAYDNADGLTLEFTHYLTQGRRLDDVLASQVRRRVQDGRDLELKVLALVSAAHSCGLSLPLAALQQALSADDASLRLALAALADEHLVRENAGNLSGLHQLRSLAIAQVVHSYPPPSRSESFAAVAAILGASHVPQLFITSLARWPELDEVALEALRSLLTDPQTPLATWTASLTALRIIDFRRRAEGWTAAPEFVALAPADRSVTIQFAIATADGDSFDYLKDEIQAAIPLVLDSLRAASTLRDRLLESVGSQELLARLMGTDEVRHAAAFLSAMRGAPLRLSTALEPGSALGLALTRAEPDELAEILYVAARVTPDLEFARALQDLIGGEAAVLQGIMDAEPTLLEARRVSRDGEEVAFARLVHLSEALDPDSAKTPVRIARLLLRSLPGTVVADVETRLARDTAFEVNGHNAHHSGLLERYALTSLDVDWNVTRSLVALDTLGTMTPTERAAAAVEALDLTADYLARTLDSWARHRRTDAQAAAINTTRKLCLALRDALTVPIESRDFLQRALPSATQRASSVMLGAQMRGDAEIPRLVEELEVRQTNDDLTSLIHSVCVVVSNHLQNGDFRLLAAHLGTARDIALASVQVNERWDLVDSPAAPESFHRISTMLQQLQVVAGALAYGGLPLHQLQREARRTNRDSPMTNAFSFADRFSANWLAGRIDSLINQGKERGVSLSVETTKTHDPDAYWPEYDVVVLVHIEDLDALANALAVVDELVLELRSHGNFAETLALPVVGDYSVAKLARRVVSSVWPGEPQVEQWASVIPPMAPTPVTDAVAAFTNALTELSSVAYLASRRDLAPAVVDLRERAQACCTEAMEVVSALGPDPIIDDIHEELRRLSTLVHDEVLNSQRGTGATRAPGMWASELGEILGGADNELNSTLIPLQEAALGWDLQRLIDRAT